MNKTNMNRMKLLVFNDTVAPIEWVPIVDVPTGSGYFWMQTLVVQSGKKKRNEGKKKRNKHTTNIQPNNTKTQTKA